MNIAYFTSIYARASDTFIRSEVLELRARGHRVHTFSVRRHEQDQHVSEEVRSEQANTDFILSHGPWTLGRAFLGCAVSQPRLMLQTLRLAWRTRAPGLKALIYQLIYVIEAAYLAQRLRALGVQVLHNHIAEASATVAMLASQLSGVPYSMTVHGPGIFYHPVRWALSEKIRRARFTACITHFCRSQCMLFSDVEDWPKLNVVHCAVGRSFLDVDIVPMPDAPRLVCIGRLCAEKGLPVLIEAVARYIEQGGRCELALVGDGPLRPAIEQIVRERNLHDSVKLLGWKSSEEVRHELEHSRAMVLPSFAEGLPVVVMEALALGRPVITTQIAGIPELVSHHENGWLVPPGAVDELVDAIREAVEAPASRLAEMGRLGTQRVARDHRLETEVDKLEGLFTQVVASAAPQR